MELGKDIDCILRKDILRRPSGLNNNVIIVEYVSHKQITVFLEVGRYLNL